jgi:urease accessory protein
VILGALLFAARGPGRGVVAALFLLSGAVHGWALAEGVTGAESTPLSAYFAGLLLIQSAVALGAWRLALWVRAARPMLPFQRVAGAALGIAGVLFTGLVLLG